MLRDQAISKMEEQGLSDQQIDAVMGFTEVFLNPVTGFFVGIVFGVFFGFILSLIIAAITKKANPQAEV